MQISVGLLLIGILQLLLLVVTVYSNASFRSDNSGPYYALNIIMTALQSINLIWLLQLMIADIKDLSSAENNAGWMLPLQSIFLFVLLAYLVRIFYKTRFRRLELLTPHSIRETIDHLPGGICFSTVEGKPVLVNHKMNDLVFQLTGHTIMNAKTTWEQLLRLRSANECVKLEEPWIKQEHIGEASDDCVFFSFSGGSIWRFRKELLTDKEPNYIQLQATDISDLYWYSKRLYENNQKLEIQYERQQSLFANIVEINHEKEVLQAKMRIHDDLGRSIITTKQHLANLTLEENLHSLAEIWGNAIRSMEDFTRMGSDAETSPEIELKKAADMIGCTIHFQGERPSGRKASLLFYSVVREALTNAVLHAKADRLNVIIRPTEHGYHVEISDNGSVAASSVTEGSGLRNLRNKLEQEGAALEIHCENGVVLIAKIPTESGEQFAKTGGRHG